MPAGRGSGFFPASGITYSPFLSLPMIFVPASSQEALHKGRYIRTLLFPCLPSIVPGETIKELQAAIRSLNPYLNFYDHQITCWYGDH
jgi:hypothetical protein